MAIVRIGGNSFRTSIVTFLFTRQNAKMGDSTDLSKMRNGMIGTARSSSRNPLRVGLKML